MCRNIVWCYLIVLALLDISLNTKLSAQGKSHGNGVSVQESLMEGISLQEWGKETEADGAAGGRGRAAPPDAVALSPAGLDFGRAALATAHVRTVTLTNTANETLHLASVAGTTPDFHASFFESKTLLPQANTTFSVVFLGRREGPVSTHLYIHTSVGVLRYPVQAVGTESDWRVWPLVGVRVPLNATLDPLLTLYNPTHTTIQVSEVYSSASWLGLRLPSGGESAPRALWSLPPHSERPLLRLRIQPPPHHHAPRHAYIRIKGNMTGGGLVVGVEAWAAQPGEYLAPLQLRLRARGTRDPPDTFSLEAGNSEDSAVKLDAEVWGATCGTAPPDPPPPPAEPLPRHTLNGAKLDSGVHVSLLRDQLDPYQELTPAAQLTLDYASMWAGAGAGRTKDGGEEETWCAGWVRVGRAAAPYSVRVLPGTLALTPHTLHFVTANREEAFKEREVYAYNEFPEPLRIEHVQFPPEVEELFHTESLAPLVLESGSGGATARLRLRDGSGAATLRATLMLRTNLTDYTLPLLLYEGKLHFEWEWPGSGSETGPEESLDLGAVGTSSTRRVLARLHNRGAATLCVSALGTDLPGATLELPMDQQRCVGGGEWTTACLTVVAPARAGALTGAVTVSTAHADSTARVSLTAHDGRLTVLPILLDAAAPYVWARAPLVLDNTMALRMRVTALSQAADRLDPALTYLMPESDAAREVGSGRTAVGTLLYTPETVCEPHCYTGLDIHSPEGAAWLSRGSRDAIEWVTEDAALHARRRALAATRHAHNVTLHVRTTRAAALPAKAAVRYAWPTLVTLAPRSPLAALGAPLSLTVTVCNPSARPLLVQPRLAPTPPPDASHSGLWSPASFALGEWKTTRGSAAPWPQDAPDAPYVLLQPETEIELAVTFSPAEPTELAAYLYLRNNLTIVEGVPLSGRGAFPSFEFGGRKPNCTSPILLEVSECGSNGAGTVRRTVTVRNTGAVTVRLREWRVAGSPCLARGFRLQPCGALTLAPNESRALTLLYTADWSRARAQLQVTVRAAGATHHFTVAGVTPARLLARCAAAAPRPPFDSALRTLGTALALLALATAVALAALDAERALRRHRSARDRDQVPPRAPLDLRALALPEPAPAAAAAARPTPPAVTRRRRSARARGAAMDAAAERRAFERWRAEVSRRSPPDDESRSSEDGDAESEPPPPAPPPAHPRGDASSSSPDSSPTPRDSYSVGRSLAGGAEQGASTGSESPGGASGSERSEREESPERAAPARGAHSPRRSPAPEEHHGDVSGTLSSLALARGSSFCEQTGSGRACEREACGSGQPGTEPHARKVTRTAKRKERREARLRSLGAPSPPPQRVDTHPPRAAPPAMRWGASWSSVVSRGAAQELHHGAGPGAPAPLAPIGSDVRRRCGSHSLFYYSAAPRAEPHATPHAEREYAWSAPPPPPDRVPFPPSVTPLTDYLEEPQLSGGYRSLESVWGTSVEPHPAAAAWLWGGGAGTATGVQPPPGFTRPYDPFHSLASIWTPAALDWRRRDRLDSANGGSPAHLSLNGDIAPNGNGTRLSCAEGLARPTADE